MAFENKQLTGETVPSTLSDVANLDFLAGLFSSGVAVHHAGLSVGDRTLVENLFSKKQIMVVVSTSVSERY